MSKKIVFCNKEISDIRYSGFTITKVYACNGKLVYSSGEHHDYSSDYLTFVAIDDAEFYFTGSALEYSLDGGETWVQLARNARTPTIHSGEKILWRGNYKTTSTSTKGNFKVDEYPSFNVEGNVLSIVYGDDFIGEKDLMGYKLNTLFTQLNIVDAENLVIPATNGISSNCYAGMFYNCTMLVNPPKTLPATNLSGATYCYADMFENCFALTKTPTLPATILSEYCYADMFFNCISLTSVCNLPAPSVANNAYNDMFTDCKSLETVPLDMIQASAMGDYSCMHMFQRCSSLRNTPILSATSFSYGFSSYAYMFKDCTSLTNVQKLEAVGESYCCREMFKGCTSLETVPSDMIPSTRPAQSCYDSMFEDCIALTIPPDLKATSLNYGCYNRMFKGCASLTKSPVLSATTLESSCYKEMFSGCTSLNEITCLATSISATDCTKDWVANVSRNGTFYKASSMNRWRIGSDGTPTYWTVVNHT